VDKTAQFKIHLLNANVIAPESYEWHEWTDRQGQACEEPLYRGEPFTPSENEQRAIQHMRKTLAFDPVALILANPETPEHQAAREAYREPVASKKHACRRCGGSGNLDRYHHRSNGICFRCGGSGGEAD